MRILHITGTYQPSTNGVAISVTGMVRSMKKLGHKVFVVAPKVKGTRADGNTILYPTIENPANKDYPIPLAPGPTAINSLISLKRIDIVHVHHPYHIGYMAKLIAKQFKCPLVFSFHTDYDSYAKKYFTFLPKILREQF